MTLYRKYRPQNLDELDSTPVREKLARILSSSYRPHAFIFTGPKGTGKTSAARIVAKILNCEELKGSKPATDNRQLKTDIEPCNKCDSCTSISEGRHLDVFEIDAASNRGIEEIRDLRDKIRLAPVSGKFKVYIIDEVHMLTNEAFNALLKTLEEPPAHAVFIMATTESDKLPETIASRCVKVEFKRANDEEIVRSLKRVILGEKIKVKEGVLEKIASFADGSFRDATKMFEQVVSEDGLSSDNLAEILGKENGDLYVFLEMLKNKETKKALTHLKDLTEKGADFKFFLSELLNTCHKLLLNNNGVSGETIPDKWKNSFGNNEIISLIKLFSQAYADLKFASKPEIPLEVAVVEWCEGKK